MVVVVNIIIFNMAAIARICYVQLHRCLIKNGGAGVCLRVSSLPFKLRVSAIAQLLNININNHSLASTSIHC